MSATGAGGSGGDGGGGGWLREDDIDKNVDDGGADGAITSMRGNDAERLRQMQISIAASSSVFPGFRFSPTDDELISYYLKKKLEGSDNCVDIIPEVDFCLNEPWDLPAISIIQSDNEWFFFSTRGKKYPNGSQSRRATQSGYWKATGKERNVKSGAITIGTKRTLVFHTGRAPRGERTEWIMHEYCMSDTTQETLVVCRLRRNGDFRIFESATRGSSNLRNLSTGDNSNSGTNEHANTQTDAFDGSNMIKSCSKESTGSYRSQSPEHNEFESDSKSKRQHIEDSPHGSSSYLKECDNEDDCFADIMNDDIIELDESAPNLTDISLKCNQNEPMSFHSLSGHPLADHLLSAQGTAVRRIRLRHQDGEELPKNPPSVCTASSAAGEQSQRWIFGVLGDTTRTAARYRFAYLILIFLILLIPFSVVPPGEKSTEVLASCGCRL